MELEIEDLLNELGVVKRKDRDNLLEKHIDKPIREDYVPWKPTYKGEEPQF